MQANAQASASAPQRPTRKDLIEKAAQRMVDLLQTLYPEETHIAFELFAQNGKLHHCEVRMTFKPA